MKFKSAETKVHFFGDAHFGHKNICRGTTDWDKKEECRDFDTLNSMNDHIVNQINKYVGIGDVLIFLGDWAFGGEDNVWKFRSRILCKKIIFVKENHDQHIFPGKVFKNCYREEPYSTRKIGRASCRERV